MRRRAAIVAFAVLGLTLAIAACRRGEPASAIVGVGAVSALPSEPLALVVTRRTDSAQDEARLVDGAGRERWTHVFDGHVMASGALEAVSSDGDDIVIGIDTRGGSALVALSRVDGATRWQTTFDAATSARAPAVAPVACGPVWIHVRESAGGGGPIVVALDRASGQVRWRWSGPHTTPATALGIDGRAYCRAERVVWLENGQGYALDAATGTQRWDRDLIGRGCLFSDRLIARAGSRPEALGWFSSDYSDAPASPEGELAAAVGSSRVVACWDDGRHRALLVTDGADTILHVIGGETIKVAGTPVPGTRDEPAVGPIRFALIDLGSRAPFLATVRAGKIALSPIAEGTELRQVGAFTLLVSDHGKTLRRSDDDRPIEVGSWYVADAVAEGIWSVDAEPASAATPRFVPLK